MKQSRVLPFFLAGALLLSACNQPIPSSESSSSEEGTVSSSESSLSSSEEPSSSSSSSSQSSIDPMDAIVEGLPSGFSVDGVYYIEDATNEIHCSFTPTFVYMQEIYEDGKGGTTALRLKDDGIYQETVNAKNEIVDTKLEKYTVESWKTFGNPFEIYDYGMEVWEEITSTRFKVAEEYLQNIGRQITGWNDTFSSIKLNVETMNLVLESTSSYGEEAYYDLTLSLTPSRVDARYETNPKAELLSSALAPLSENNWTAKSTNIDLDDKTSADVVSYSYRTDDCLYLSFKSLYDSPHGYYFDEDKVYQFSVENNTSVNFVDYASELERIPDFPFEYSFPLSFDLFEFDEERNAFVTKDLDAACLVAGYFGYDPNTYKEFAYFGEEVAIYLNKANHLAGLSIKTNIYGSHFQTNLVFSEVGTTTLPIKLDTTSLIDFTPILGKWNCAEYDNSLNGEGVIDLALTVSETKVIVSSTASKTAGLQNEEYAFAGVKKSQDGLHYIYHNNAYGDLDLLLIEGKLLLTISSLNVSEKGGVFEAVPVSEGNWPAQFKGTWSGSMDYGTFYGSSTLSVVITDTSISLNGEEATVVDYDAKSEEIILSFKGDTLYLYDGSYGKWEKLGCYKEGYSFFTESLVKEA